MSEPLKELRQLSDEELIKRHDKEASRTEVGINHYLTELARRDQDRATLAMLEYTRQIKRMTLVMTIATVVNLIVFILTFFRN